MDGNADISIPVIIVSGYLGAGKTTLVNHMLRNAGGMRLAIMVNDFGNLPIDEDLIEARDEDMISLSGGCVCCSFGSGMMTAFEKLGTLDPAPDHVLLEASGVAYPSSIASAISLLENFYFDKVVCLVDAELIRQQAGDKYLVELIENQIKSADIILLNKVDLILDEEDHSLYLWLGHLAPNAVIVECEQGVVSPGLLLESMERLDTPGPGPYHGNLSDYRTTTVDPAQDQEPEEFAQSLIRDYPAMVRAKGFLKDPSGKMKTLQIVGQRVNLHPAPDGVKAGIVVIEYRPVESGN